MTKITTLIENNPDVYGELQYEHGLSLLIEYDGRYLLFDTGQTGACLENAKKLQVDIKKVDGIIVSHGHYDHAGGVKSVCNFITKGTPMYVGNGFFEEKYKIITKATDSAEQTTLNYRYNGIDFTKKELEDCGILLSVLTEDTTYLSENIVLFKNFERITSFEQLNKKFVKKEGDSYKIDLFQDEIALGLVTSKGLIVIAGCSHVGIINMIQTIEKRVTIPIYAIIGGTHLVEASEERINLTIEALKKRKIQWVAVSHCTGERGMLKMEEAFLDQFQKNVTGNMIEFME